MQKATVKLRCKLNDVSITVDVGCSDVDKLMKLSMVVADVAAYLQTLGWRVGVESIVFGTDWDLSDPVPALRWVDRLTAAVQEAGN